MSSLLIASLLLVALGFALIAYGIRAHKRYPSTRHTVRRLP